MGNEGSKKKTKPIDKSKLDILLKQIFFTAQLNKDRRKGQQNSKEKELLALVREPANKRNKDNEYSKASAITNDIKSIKAHECIMRYSDILKDNQMVIQLSNGDTSKINDLIPYVESIIWGCQKCNIECVKQFEEFLYYTYGQEAHVQLIQFTKVTPEIKSHFGSILPSEKEVKLYLIEFCNRNGISLDIMNEIGHGLSPTELADLPDPNAHNIQKPSEPSQGGNQGSQGGQGFYPGGNFQQGNYPPNNYQPGFPQGGSYPPNNYQPSFNPNSGYPQPNYPPNNYQPQPNYQQQGGYPPFNGYSQPNYSQGGLGGPGGSYQPNPNPGFIPQNYQGGSQQSFGSNPQGSQNPSNNSYQSPNFPSQNPSGNIGSQGGQKPVESSNKGNDQDLGGYPAFSKFTDANTGGKAGYDPLDELDMRLKNIKNGL